MDSIRQNKVGRLIQKELASIFQSEAKALVSNAMITVTAVKISPDLSYARVNLSIFAVNSKSDVMEVINNNRKEIRHLLAKKIRNQIRAIPELIFIMDDTLDYNEHIDELLKH